MSGDRARLDRLLGDPQLAWLLARVRRRLERGEEMVGVATLAGATDAQRVAADRLLGRRPRAGSVLSVRAEEVDAVLRGSGAWPAGLADAVVTLTGPVTVRADAAAAERAAWEAAWAPLDRGLADRPALLAWWREEVVSGLPRRLAGSPVVAGVLVHELLAVLERLPAGGVAIGSLAHAATGSAHGLDAGPLATLVLRAVRVIAGTPPAPGDRARSAAADRQAWAAVGVVRDELSSTVLTLGLPVLSAGSTAGDADVGADRDTGRTTGGATGAALAAWAAVGQPVVLTLRHLRADPPSWRSAPPGGTVWVCENPVVLAAVADAWVERTSLAAAVGDLPAARPSAARTPPAVVCTAGHPSAAAMTVLRALAGCGWALRHHGDLDPDGVRITNRLVGEVGAVPWRMGAPDYERALTAGLGRRSGRAPAAAVWDEGLGPAMARSRQVVEEEAVLDLLVADVLAGA